jgi:hypothetical protein
MTTTAAAQHTGHDTTEARNPWGGCEAPVRGYELRADRRPTTRREGGSLPRRAE